MTPANYGSVFSCCLFGSLMMLYLYVFCRSKRFILRNGTFVIYLAVGVVTIRMLLPWNFHFAANVESHKILPFLFNLLRVKILSVEFLTILVIIFCFGSCLRLALYFYKLVRYRHLLHQLDPLDDIRILRIFSDILEEYHCTKQILIYQVPGLSSPAISGLIHPVILLPDREYSDQDLRFIFMHELNHYLHNDLWKIFFWELVVCIYWWNPLSYMIRRLIKDTAEYANKKDAILSMIVQRFAEIYFHNLYILDLFLYCSPFRCALSFSQVRQLQTMTMMALLFLINLTAVILFI